ncbi:MAG: hypothetical protein MUF64_31450 [Polyangiaceae bacterium]|jgi:hypothetical protein|nr:hypothetical protein [Polyangiaceae bacterium]
MSHHDQESASVHRTFGVIGLLVAGLLTLLLWGGVAGMALLGYIVGASTGTTSGPGLGAALIALGGLVPLVLLGGALGCALAPRRRG